MPLKFIHIPRTAGTSIEDHYIKYNIKYGRFDTEYCTEALTQNNIWGTQAEKWHSILPDTSTLWFKYHFFTIIRDPIDRLLSEYYHPYQPQHILANKAKESVADFNKNIKNILGLVRTQPHVIGHYAPQMNFINFHHLDRIHLLDFNQLQTDISLVHKKYHIVTPLLTIKSGHSKNKKFTSTDLYEDIKLMCYDIYNPDINLYRLISTNQYKCIYKSSEIFETIFDIC